MSRIRAVSDAGESLVELLITMLVIGIAVPALAGAVLLATDVSSQDRRQTQAQRLLTTWEETITENVADGNWSTCPAPSHYEASPFALTSPPSGFHPSVVSVDVPSGSGYGACTAALDKGSRRLRLRISVDAGLYPSFTVDQYVVIRKPCAGMTSC